jgi:hypothetical protein
MGEFMTDEKQKVDDVLSDPTFPTIEEAWLLCPMGNITFRFGPYTSIEAGVFMKECVEQEAGMVVVFNCGRNFTTEFAKSLNTLKPMDAEK